MGAVVSVVGVELAGWLTPPSVCAVVASDDVPALSVGVGVEPATWLALLPVGAVLVSVGVELVASVGVVLLTEPTLW